MKSDIYMYIGGQSKSKSFNDPCRASKGHSIGHIPILVSHEMMKLIIV